VPVSHSRAETADQIEQASGSEVDEGPAVDVGPDGAEPLLDSESEVPVDDES
jgi:hypothetical protein